jgi:hypothetical protein
MTGEFQMTKYKFQFTIVAESGILILLFSKERLLERSPVKLINLTNYLKNFNSY